MKKKAIKEEENRAERNARAHVQDITDMIQRYHKAQADNNDNLIDEISREIDESILSLEVNNGWYVPGTEHKPEQFRILLSTGGPACRIEGILDNYCYPEKVEVQFQDWFTSWEILSITEEEEEALLEYARFLYYGEG